MATYLVELYLTGSPVEAWEAEAGRVRAAAEQLRREGAEVAYVRSIVVPDDESCFHLYEAASAATAAEACRRAGVVYERIVEAHSFGEGEAR